MSGDAKKPAALVGATVFLLALARMLPFDLNNEEPRMLAAAGELFAANNGQLLVPARLAYLVASPFGEWALVVTNLTAALTVGLVAAYVTTWREAIPDARARWILALSLPLLPIPEPGPYVGPLNNQWWFAIATLGIALSPPRRWHLPALAAFGLSGLAPCLLWPVFRDRRGLVLLAVAGVQGLVLLASHRERFPYPMDAGYLAAMASVAGAMLVARLPTRTRLAFLYAGLVILALGAFGDGRLGLNYRYLAVPGAVIVIGLGSRLLRLHDPDVTRHDVPRSASAGVERAGTSAHSGPDGVGVAAR
jgi:hypothetical protein